MAFWGVEVKPGKPFTHSREKAKGRLRISQATLGLGNAAKKSVVQCNVGKKSPVLLCVLLPDKTESSHLDLEFEETDDVVFSVIGPRSIYLTGYYVRQNLHSGLHSDTESYGEDVGDSRTDGSNYCSDDDKYEDSFIDDGELKVSPPSPVSSNNDMDDAMPENDKPKDGKSRSKRLKKKYQVVESDDDAKSHGSEDEDGYLLSVFKNKIDAKRSNDGEKNGQSIAETNGRSTDNVACSQKPEGKVKPPLRRKEKPQRTAKVSSADEENQVKSESPNEEGFSKESVDDKVLADNKVLENQVGSKIIDQDMPTSNDKNVILSLDLEKPKKKRKERSKTEEQPHEVEIDKDHDKDKNHCEEDREHKLNDPVKLEDGANHASPELGSKHGRKSKKRKKEIKEDINEHSDRHSPRDSDLKQDSLLADNPTKDLPASDGEPLEKIIDNNISMKCELQANDNRPEKKTKKSTKKKDKSRVDTDLGLRSADAGPIQRTLSNGLIIEEVSNGPSDGKVAVPGKKVKIFYTAMLKENGHVFDTNVGKNACKFRLGDKEISDGWNVGIVGMRVGDKRRITIRPSMGFGKAGLGENVPPNSWTVFDVELVGVRK